MMIRTATLLLAGLCALPAGAQEKGAHATFHGLLGRHVRDERVDYLTLRDQDFAELETYLKGLAAVDPGALSRDARLAHYINLYNATMIRAVIERLQAGYRTSNDNWKVFDEPLVQMKGKTISLNALEHEIIRKQFKEPRIHAALVCGARSCPPLVAHAYNAGNLEDTLALSMRNFIADPTRNRVEEVARLSKIFEWYADDFGGKDGVLNYVQNYFNRDLTGLKVEFLEYSWDLNIATPKGEWVQIPRADTGLQSTPDGAAQKPLPAGSIVEVLEKKGDHLRIRRPFGKGDAWVAASATKPYAPASKPN